MKNKSPETITNKPFILKILQFIEQHNLLPNSSKIVIGLSGGPDSVFLLYLLHDLKKEKNFSLIAAHLDHQWRTDSAQDVKFCHNLCAKLGIPFVSTTASELPPVLQKKGSKEEIGRRMRRYFLQQVRENNDADCIALGHHLQDQEETFFIRLIRGTTLSGLTSMKPRESFYIRPLLETNKQDIVAYLQENKISYLTDPSNISESFLRNRIRLKVLPALQECDQRFDANFLRTLNVLQETENYLQQLTTATFNAIAQFKDEKIQLCLEKFKKIDPFMQRRILLYWLIQAQVPFTPTKAFLDEILRFFEKAEGKKHILGPTWAIEKKQKKAMIVLHK
jgi:tRNA(Ile)-lysidine synthase